jgi:hypothetical protein
MERRTIVSSFTQNELINMCIIWQKRGYKLQGKVICERISFEEKTGRVSRPVYLQLMVMQEEENDGA